MNCKCKVAVAFLLILVILVPLSLSCGGGGEKGVVTITIGEITDLTGPGSPAVITLHYCLQDMISYYNDEGLIPGVKLKMVSWDTRYDASREIPGYEWVREKGAKLIVVIMPQSGPMLMPFAARDKIPLAALSCHRDTLSPPGWVFNLSNSSDMNVKTLLKWISEEHWDYSKGIPKLGLVGWQEHLIVAVNEAMKEYAQDNPSKFDYVGARIVPFGQIGWAGEVEALKDCDYVAAIGFPMGNIIKEFHQRGYKPTFIDPSAGAASYRGFLVDMLGYEGLDGTLTSNSAPFWTDDTPIVRLAKQLLEQYRPKQAEDVIYAGLAYVGGVHNLLNTFQILANAIEAVGPESFSGQAYYDAAIKYQTSGPLWEGYPQWEFTETKRYLVNDVIISEFSAEAQDLVNLSGWLPLITD
jgi:hypothetical protein